ncbi:MAG: hypothetical protein N4A70_06055 [Pelagimonas sp.]|jgi:hypothetical protein|nr:hypothetical protein [Pelagimonas sp.]
MNEKWGTFALGEKLSTRRNQQLGLGAAIRHYNEMSVPGIGGIWFCMPLIWSLIGIKIASEIDGLPAIRAANAIEAKVMLDAIKRGDTSNRILGRQKLPRQNIGKGSFKRLARANTYVTQPYRQACAQPLIEFGLVTSNSARFNSFALTDRGEALLSPFEKPIRRLSNWVKGHTPTGDFTSMIAPESTLPEETVALLTRLIFNEGKGQNRRQDIQRAFENLSAGKILEGEIKGLSQDHVDDLKIGIALVRLRELGVKVLDRAEDILRRKLDHREPVELGLDAALKSETLLDAINALQNPGGGLADIATGGTHGEIQPFLRDCQQQDQILLQLVKRDKSVLQLRDGKIVPGPAFDPPRPDSSIEETQTAQFAPELPRLQRFHSLINDLGGV